MSFITIIETLLIGPLKLLFEVIFNISNELIGHPGLSIIMLSLAMNILVLPLYRQADAMQERARDTEARLHDGVAHIKKTFSGDERMMILQTYYRQNNYSPLSALSGSVSLLLEIPFFMAAYQFLSHLDILKGVSLGPIKDLSTPDGLLVIGGIAINLLPVIMTLVNIISSAIYLKGFPLKTKIQLYAMALFFLVFLYTSPSGLVFYWTLNNVFSLVKTIFYKIKNPKKVLNILMSVIGLALLGFTLFFYDTPSVKRKLLIGAIGIALELPLLSVLAKRILPPLPKINKEIKPNKKLFLLGSLFLTFLIGLLIPTTFIAASPQEYVDITYFYNPLWYVVSTLCLSAGTFLVWFRVFYWLGNDKSKALFDRLVLALSGVAIINYMFFGTNLGIISPSLKYDNEMIFKASEQILNSFVVLVLFVGLYVFAGKWRKAAVSVLLTAVIALGGMSAVNMVTINKSVNEIKVEKTEGDEIPTFTLNKNGKNVVIIMLDRAMGAYLPYIINEKPELKQKLDGFTFYSNTISFGGGTNIAAPALFGGYEYTPVEMNKRDAELLVSKHNEAVKVMPALFHNNGFKVTVNDPIYTNYRWVPDITVFDDLKSESFRAQITQGKFENISDKETVIQNNLRNFFCFGLMKSFPLSLQSTLYNNGKYNKAVAEESAEIKTTQTNEGMSISKGYNASFMRHYNTLVNMSNMTRISEDKSNTFMYLTNDTTHNPMLLQTPDYTPQINVDNTKYDAENKGRFTVDGKTLPINNYYDMTHYHANMAALIQLGNWFDYLRENDIYDNTRIIVVSDHGLNSMEIKGSENNSNAAMKYLGYYNPLLLVKDFDSKGFDISQEFMTNADVPTIAAKGLIENPVNPFTNKPISSDEKTAHDQFILATNKWDTTKNNGTEFLPDGWISVKDNLWDTNQLQVMTKEAVLKDHSFN